MVLILIRSQLALNFLGGKNVNDYEVTSFPQFGLKIYFPGTRKVFVPM